ncbi:LysE family transporter [Pseudomonas viridiflava]|uniref:LysE family translocator n=1 Tax=Pseudomonas syringae group TaxID=136849 RepID=UPI0015E3AF75|nr:MULTISPECIES: LysE family transporter [Pseudomonas syringae group]MBA1228925.1 LysE family transporter [Pseudomonas viridiflava]MCF5707189.1 threonine transporter RhtB [Pseudomonas syringae]
MSSSIFLALLAVLAVPGPTNSLLFQTGVNRGFNVPSLQWVGSEWLAYVIQITAWGITLDRVARDYPWVATLSKAFAVCFLFYIAMKLWNMARKSQHTDAADSQKPGLSPAGLFVATLSNPKGLFFASFVAPAGTFLHSADYLAFIATFTAVVLPVGSAWVLFGSCFGGRMSSARSSRLMNKGVSMVIGLFATGLLYNLASHSFIA